MKLFDSILNDDASLLRNDKLNLEAVFSNFSKNDDNLLELCSIDESITKHIDNEVLREFILEKNVIPKLFNDNEKFTNKYVLNYKSSHDKKESLIKSKAIDLQIALLKDDKALIISELKNLFMIACKERNIFSKRGLSIETKSAQKLIRIFQNDQRILDTLGVTKENLAGKISELISENKMLSQKNLGDENTGQNTRNLFSKNHQGEIQRKMISKSLKAASFEDESWKKFLCGCAQYTDGTNFAENVGLFQKAQRIFKLSQLQDLNSEEVLELPVAFVVKGIATPASMNDEDFGNTPRMENFIDAVNAVNKGGDGFHKDIAAAIKMLVGVTDPEAELTKQDFIDNQKNIANKSNFVLESGLDKLAQTKSYK